ncbi:MAG: hypothetical protein NT116_01115, partial [Candidatus Parcubacteria bacterium]|nr:hypothetical protein [Candidatus Parcubacteria bacterium]
MEQPKNSEAPVLEMARCTLLQAKELEMSNEQRKEIIDMVTQATEQEKAGNLSGAFNILQQVKTKMEKIRDNKGKGEKLEHELDLKEQYEEQVETLKQVGILEKLSNGKWGIKDILGQERPIPSYEEIKERMKAKAEMLDEKR